MRKSKWRKLVKDIYVQEISPKLRELRHHFHPMERDHHHYELRRLSDAMRSLSLIESSRGHDSDISEIFTSEHLRSIVQNIENANNNVNLSELKHSGIVDVFDEYREEIISELDVNDLPPEDFAALADAGSPNPRAELRLRIHVIKEWNSKTRRNEADFRHVFSNSISRVDEILEKRLDYLKELDSDRENAVENQTKETLKGPRRRWFKGLGSIGRGTILTAVDISLLAGWGSMDFSSDTKIVGGVTSIAAGLGDIAIGVGELRDE